MPSAIRPSSTVKVSGVRDVVERHERRIDRREDNQHHHEQDRGTQFGRCGTSDAGSRASGAAVTSADGLSVFSAVMGAFRGCRRTGRPRHGAGGEDRDGSVPAHDLVVRAGQTSPS